MNWLYLIVGSPVTLSNLTRMRTTIELNSSNIETCVPMYCSAFNEEPWNDGWTNDAALERLHTFTQIPKFHGLAIVINEQPAAMVCGWGERWATGWAFLIKEMCVHPNYRRAGLGTELVKEFENILVKNDFKGTYLETLEGPSADFYLSLNFEKIPLVMLRKRLV